MITLTNVENALKSVYLGVITELMNTKTNPLLSKIEHTCSDVWGKEVRKAVKYGINNGVNAGGEDTPLLPFNNNNYLQFVTTLKNLYGQIEISDKAIRASADGRGSFTDLLNNELEDLLVASKFNLGRMLYGDGSGKLATFTNGDNLTVNSTKNLIEGMVVDVFDKQKVYSGLRINCVNRENNTISFDSKFHIETGNTLYVQNSKDREITGIEAIFNGKELYGLSRDDHPILNPYVKSINGKFNGVIIQETIDFLETNANSTVDFIAVSADVKYAYQEYLCSHRRNVDIMELDGGFKCLSFNGIPFVYDRFVESGTMYLLNTSAFKLHQLCDWRYLENENGKILRQTQGKPTYTAILVKYCDLICNKPNGQAKLTGITR